MNLTSSIAIVFSISMSVHAATNNDNAEFTFEDLKAMAKTNAAQPYAPAIVRHLS